MSQPNISNEKLHANQQNAQHSTGPRTEAGKQRVSQNALKHGLLARQAVLPGEDIHEYDGYIRSLEQKFQPADFLEFSLIRQMVDAEWRLRRLTRIETSIAFQAVAERRRSRARYYKPADDLSGYGPGLSPETVDALRETELFGDAMSNEARTIDIYGRHGARLLRQFERAISQFTQLEKARAAKPQPGHIHRRPPQSQSAYTPPPPADPLDSGRWAPSPHPDIDTDAPVTLAQSLDPLVRSRLRGDPDRLQAGNTKQTHHHPTNTIKTTYNQDPAEPRTKHGTPRKAASNARKHDVGTFL